MTLTIKLIKYKIKNEIVWDNFAFENGAEMKKEKDIDEIEYEK